MTTFCLNLIILAGVLWAPVSFSSSADFDIIYGEDNRVDTYECTNPLFKTLAKSTAALVHQENIKIRGNGAELRGKSLGEIFRLCDKERFFHQPFVAQCSGFLVAPDIIVSAGHCFETKDMCTKHDWVFDFKVDRENQGSVTVPSTSVYKCKEIIEHKLTKNLDYAVIRLDRKVTDRLPVKLATEWKVGAEVVLIGHPSGLPQKIADHAFVKSVSDTEFRATVDAFQINSGSAVFNAKSGELMGILVRGKIDYRTNQQYKCTEPNVTSEDDEGEDISKNTQFIQTLRSSGSL